MHTNTIRRLDNEVTVHVDTTRQHNAPNYAATADGEQFPMYLLTEDSTALPSSQTIRMGDNHLVAFLDSDEASWWWADQGGAATRDDAEELLRELADGRDGAGFIVAAPVPDVPQR